MLDDRLPVALYRDRVHEENLIARFLSEKTAEEVACFLCTFHAPAKYITAARVPFDAEGVEIEREAGE